jgi:tetratricopeptide (TPR) repeat protein
MRRFLLVAVVLALGSSSLSASSRVTFMRTLPATYDLGRAESIAVVYAIGDNEKISRFVETFVEQMNRSGILRAESAIEYGQHFLTGTPDEGTVQTLRKRHPAEVYIGVNPFTCSLLERSGEGSTHDPDGARVKRVHGWADASCRARIDVIRANDMKRLFSFFVRGEGTSPRVVKLTSDERSIALEQAARYAAVTAAGSLTPRRVRESIQLRDDAPAFDDGAPFIDGGKLEEARAVWTRALQKEPSSPALHFNIAVVSEALGDLGTARRHFEQARHLSPTDTRYRVELELFERRNVAMK